jgi:uncharacterized tellurite resistance protein B-like protein
MRNSFKKLFTPKSAVIKSHLKNMLMVAKADGAFDMSEYEILLLVAQKFNFSKSEIKKLQSELETIDFIVPECEKKKFSQLYDLVMVLLADGKIHEKEMECCEGLAEKLGYNAQNVKTLVKNIIENIKIGNSTEDAYTNIALI